MHRPEHFAADHFDVDVDSCADISELNSAEGFDDPALSSCLSYRSNKEYEFNQFFISTETSSFKHGFGQGTDGRNSLSDADPAESHERNEKHGESAEAESFEIFHGIMESEDLEIFPSAGKCLSSCHEVGDNSDSDYDVDVNDHAEDSSKFNVDNADKSMATIVEAQTFLEDIKHHSDARSKILDEVSSLSNEESKTESEHLKTELDLIEKLDTKLQELENTEPSTCSSRHPLSIEGFKSIPTVVIYLRDEKRRWRRQLRLKKSLQKLEMVESSNSNKHMLRNIQLGPRARYFSLTKEEEDMVEELLSRPDFIDDEVSEGNSTTSSLSTAYDLEGDDALRMAQIDEKLEQFIEIHSQCGSPSLTSVTLSIPKLQSVCSQNSNGTMRTPSLEGNASSQGEMKSEPQALTSSVDDYLAEKKESRKHQEKVESIDKRLRELILGEAPERLPKEQLDLLVSQCMMEQNLEVTMRPFLCLKI